MARKYRRKAASVRKQIESVLAKKVEVKKSTIVNTATLTTSGVIIPLMEIAQGVAHDQRLGNSLNLLSFYVRVQSALADSGYNRVRVALIRTRQPTDGTMAQLFENTSFVTFGAQNAGWDYDFVEKVYMDKNTTLNQLVANQRMTKYWKRYIKCKDRLHYDDAATSPPNENYYLILVSDSLVLPHPTCNLICTQRFTDM